MTEDPASAYRPIFRLGGSYAEQAGDYLAGRRAVAEPRDAASVLLLRAAPGQPGTEVYMLRRARSMKFAPGASVFPGGSVDPRDAEDEVAALLDLIRTEGVHEVQVRTLNIARELLRESVPEPQGRELGIARFLETLRASGVRVATHAWLDTRHTYRATAPVP